MDRRMITHYDGCWESGPAHYDCARMRAVELEASWARCSQTCARLQGEVERLRQRDAEHEQFRLQHRDCDAMAVENQRLRRELSDAYAEIRKQVFGSRVVFDRELCERAEKAGEQG